MGTAGEDAPAAPFFPFPVVGIGASAGGLESFQEFFKAVPPKPGMAFVLIQHLPPDRESILAEIIQRSTPMPVVQIEDRMDLAIDHVYVIQPGGTIVIEEGRFHLIQSAEKRGLQRPVDDFFRSLADAQGERAIAIVMSGMGSNGTEGTQAIKVAGGLCIAQRPDSAKYPSMPKSLVDSGQADFVLRLDEMPAVLSRYSKNPFADATFDSAATEDQKALEDIMESVRVTARHDFGGYKKQTVARRIQRRMGLNQIQKIRDYAQFVRQNANEVVLLADDLMIHVTGFFRDPEVWEALAREVMRPLMEERPTESPLRLWVAACATGEEAYSVAIIALEVQASLGKRFEVRIFATDTAPRALSRARAGVFAGGIESDLSRERLERFFYKEDSMYRVRKEVRDMVTFAPQNLLQDPPFSNIDVCTCRNLLIYLEPSTQRKVLHVLHFALRPGGTLVLGTSETISAMDESFVPFDKRLKFYRRVGTSKSTQMDFGRFQTSKGGAQREWGIRDSSPRPDVQAMARKTLLERFTPAAVVVNAEFEIVYFHGDTSQFLQPEQGEPTRNLMALLPSALRSPIREALDQVEKQGGLAPADGPVDGGGSVAITVTAIGPRTGERHFLLTFGFGGSNRQAPPSQNFAPPEGLADKVKRLQVELESAVEDHQLSTELLKTSNEEVMSVNEELQSTNEELETGKEELQSLNEELTTANAQLQGKMEELETTTNDLTSLLRSTDIAVVFLDPSLKIRRFTPSARDLVEILQTDIGRPISDLARKFEDPDFLADGAAVIQTGRTVEKEVDTRSGRTFVRRILPYKTTENKVDGVVIVFVEISDRKAAEAELRRSEQLYRIVMDGLTEHAIVVLDTQGRFKTWPASAERFFGYGAADILGKPLATIYGGGPERGQAAGDKLALALKSGTVSDEHWYRRANGSMFWGSGAISPLWDPKGQLIGFVKVVHDYTERKRAEDALKKARDAAEEANTAKDEFLANVSHELRTPLSSILLWTSVIEDKSAQAAPKLMDEGINAIKRSAEEQKDLIEDLIDSARIESGKMELDIERTAMAPLVDSAVQTIRPSASAKGVQIHLKQDPELGDVMADPTRCHQVIWNLVGNAVKFTPDGGTVSIRTAREGDTVVIEVKDTGAGIDGAFLPHVFSRFGQASRGTRRSTSGLGLGLSIARTLVELHRGTIAAESQGAGRGATFTVRLPLPRLQPRATPSPRPPAALAGKLAGRRILLVENDANLRRGLTVVLEAAQMTVDAVDSAASALETINRARPDFIVSDIGLSTMDGYDFIKAVRAAERKRGEKPVPALALTAFAGDQHRVRALESGYQDWMAKPVEPGRILEAVERLGEG
jgi:two-component system CheB/CheR fusion protein